MRKVLIALVLISLFGFSQAHAEQFFPYTGIVRDHTPDVCLLDNTEGGNRLAYTQNLVNMWSDGLDKLTFSHNWDMKVRLVDKVQAANCDIVFNYDLERHDWTSEPGAGHHESEELGVTRCDGDTNYCTINIHILNLNQQQLKLTVLHEFGHALGLGHRQGNTIADGMAAFLSDDLMAAYAKPFQHFTEDDFLALINLYGHNGWGPVKIVPDAYVIHHATHIKVYCNGVNATGGICDSVFMPVLK